MKENTFTQAVDYYVEVQMKAIDAIIEKFVKPLDSIGNPEKLVGRPYEEWVKEPDTIQRLTQIYGTQEPNPLSDLIFRKKYEEVKKLEAEEH